MKICPGGNFAPEITDYVARTTKYFCILKVLTDLLSLLIVDSTLMSYHGREDITSIVLSVYGHCLIKVR